MSDRDADSQLNPLAPTLEPLMTESGGDAIRAALDRLHELRFRHVQLSATQPGMRPRDLDGSARRDVLATLRRREMNASGLDVWIPPRHFVEAQTADRAVNAVQQAIELAADLGRVPISVNLPVEDSSNPTTARVLDVARILSAHGEKFGVQIANHTVPVAKVTDANIGIGIDPAAWLSQGKDPAAALLEHAPRVISIRLCDLLHSGLRAAVGDRREGQLDLVVYRVAVSVAQYARPVVLDARQWSDPWAGLTSSRSAWMKERAVK